MPFWANWPFETLLLPRSHIRRMYDLNHDQKVSLADILRKINIRYDNLFNVIFPYSMGWHGEIFLLQLLNLHLELDY